MNRNPARGHLIAVFDPPTEKTCNLNYAEGARCGRTKKHDGGCSQVSRWGTDVRGVSEPFTPASSVTVSAVLRRYASWLDKQNAEARTLPDGVLLHGVLRTPEAMRGAAAELLQLADWFAERPEKL